MIDPELKTQEYNKSINILNERKIVHDCIPKKFDIWLYVWIRALNHLVSKET